MPEPASPRQVVESLMQGISDARWQELDGLYAGEAVVEYPFALPTPMTLKGSTPSEDTSRLRQHFR